MFGSAAVADTPSRSFKAPPRADISIHLTPFAPGIPHDANLQSPCRWIRLYGAEPRQAMAKLCQRLDRPPFALRLSRTPQAEIEVIARVEGEEQVLAIIVEGLTLETALEALAGVSFQ